MTSIDAIFGKATAGKRRMRQPPTTRERFLADASKVSAAQSFKASFAAGEQPRPLALSSSESRLSVTPVRARELEKNASSNPREFSLPPPAVSSTEAPPREQASQRSASRQQVLLRQAASPKATPGYLRPRLAVPSREEAEAAALVQRARSIVSIAADIEDLARHPEEDPAFVLEQRRAQARDAARDMQEVRLPFLPTPQGAPLLTAALSRCLFRWPSSPRSPAP